ncbi:glycosyl-4,4'-diaponeurosporenoate acyltransferase CrtO family protein [Psychroserpens sp.]
MLIYFINSISLTFASWLIGLVLNNIIKKASFYSKISHFNFIKEESTYRIIGMGSFKWILKNSFFKYFNQKLKFETRPNISQLQEIRNEMTYSEIGHFIAFIFILVIMILKVWNGEMIFATTLFVFNIIFNLYPSLLQQQNKKRIDRILR